jgi:hypothetical protein
MRQSWPPAPREALHSEKLASGPRMILDDLLPPCLMPFEEGRSTRKRSATLLLRRAKAPQQSSQPSAGGALHYRFTRSLRTSRSSNAKSFSSR